MIQAKQIAVDIQDFESTRHGPRIINAMLSNGGSLYQTARKRKAVLMRRETLELLKTRMKFTTEEALDGLVSIVVPAPAQ